MSGRMSVSGNVHSAGKLRQVWRKHVTNGRCSRNRLAASINLKTKTLLKKPLSMV